MYLLKKLRWLKWVLTAVKQLINSIKAYSYGVSKYLAYKNEEIKCNIKEST